MVIAAIPYLVGKQLIYSVATRLKQKLNVFNTNRSLFYKEQETHEYMESSDDLSVFF